MVERFTTTDEDPIYALVPHQIGEWVAYKDYETLLAENRVKGQQIVELRAAIAQAECTCESYGGLFCPRCQLVGKANAIVSTRQDKP